MGSDPVIEIDRFSLRRWVPTIAIMGVGFGLILGFIVMIPTLLIASHSGLDKFFFKEEYVLLSPDGHYEIRVYRKVDIPADSFIDPSATISVVLYDTASGAVLVTKTISIHEYQELQESFATWADNRVVLSEIETHKDIMVEIELPK